MLALPSLPQHNVHPPIAHCFDALQEFHTLMFYLSAFTRGLFWIFLRVRFQFVFIMLLARARQKWYLVFTIVYSTFFRLGPPLLNPLLKCSQLCDLMLFALSWDSFHPPRHRPASWIRQSCAVLIVAPVSSITFIIISTSSPSVAAKIVAWGNSQWLRVCGEFSEDLACLSWLTGSLPDALYHHPFIAGPVALQKLWYIMHGYNLLIFFKV